MSLLMKNMKSRFSLEEEDLDDISIPVDEDGKETNESVNTQSASTDNPTIQPWYDVYQSDMEMVTEVVPLTITNINSYTTPYIESNKMIPYCPVYVYKDNNDHLVITAYITGQIIDVHEYIDLLDILEVMLPDDRCYIFIDSPGGYVATGAAISSCTDTCKGSVTGIARGLCASAGSLIWSACHHQVAMPFANFMYHMSSHMDVGNSESIRSRAEAQVRYVKECLLKVALEKGHITEEELTKICIGKDNVFISAQVMNQRINDLGE